MKRLSLLLVLLALVFAQGCSSLDDAPAAYARGRTSNGTSLDTGAFPTSCGVTAADVAAVKLDEPVPTTVLTRATTQLAMLREAVKKVDEKLQEHFARVGPALEDDKAQHLASVFEDKAKVVVKILRDDDYFDDVELSVKEIRERHFAAVKKLAATLDAIGSNQDNARAFAPYSELSNAYLELSDSPCPARSVRFAAILLSLDANPDSPYAAQANATSKDYAVLMLYNGLARALVERAVANTSPTGNSSDGGDDAPNKALAEVRGFLGTASGVTNNVMSFFQSRETARAKALDPNFKVEIEGHDLTPALRAVNAVLFWWNVTEAAAAGDVQTLLLQSPAIAESAAKGIAALASHFEATRIAGAATNVAKAASIVGRTIGFVFAAKGIIDTLDRLDDPGSNTGKLVVELVGQCMVLAGSFMPPPLSFAVMGIGQIAVWISSFIGDPPPDELAPLLDQLVTDGTITQAERVAIVEAHPTNISSLGRALHLKPADVRWTLETVRLGDQDNIAKNEGLFGSPYMGLYRIHLESGLEGDAMGTYLRSIGSSRGAEGRLELHEFVLYMSAAALFQNVSVKQAITTRRNALDEYDVKYDAEDVGITPSRGLTLTRAAFQRAIDRLPNASCPAEAAARCSGDGRFVVWCQGSILMTDDCWDSDKSCVRAEAESRSHCVERHD